MLYLIAPAFNEGPRIRDFVADAIRHGEQLDGGFRLVIVDDGSRDESVPVLDELARDGQITLLRHERNRGIAAAFTTGIGHALAQCTDDDAVAIIESDGSNDLAILPRMLERLNEGADAVIGSRNIAGGGYVGFPFTRRLLSRFGNALFRSLAPVPGVTDYTIFYRVYRASALRVVFRNDRPSPLEFPDFSANAEILFRLAQADQHFAEVAHAYRYDRKDSASKLRVWRNTRQSLRLIAVERSRRGENGGASTSDRKSCRPVALIVGLMTLVQLVLAGLVFENPSDILRDAPILSYDHFAHYFISTYIGEVWRATGDLWAFLPDWFAGAHLTGFLEAQGPLVLVGVLTDFRHMAFWLQVIDFVAAGLMPIAFYRGFRQFGLGTQSALGSTFLAFLFWIGSFPAFLGLVGDSASAIALFGSIYFFALLWRLASTGGRSGAVRLLVLLPLYVLTHKSTVIIIAPVAAAIYVAYWRIWNRRLVLWSFAIAVAVFAANAFWILPAPSFARYMTVDASPFYKDEGLRQLAYDFFSTTAYFPPWELRDMPALTVLRWIVVAIGIWGLVKLRRSGDTPRCVALAGGILVCAAISYGSSLLPFLRELKPLRLVVPLNLLLLAAAGSGIDRSGFFREFERRFRHRRRLLLVAGLAILTVVFCFLSMFKVRLAVDPIRTRFPEDIAALRAWIEESTDTTGRILFEQWKEMPEDSEEPAHHLHAGAFLPRGRLYANGFHPIVYSEFAYPDFVAGELTGMPVAEWSDERFDNYFRAYNVRWVVAWTAESIERIDRYAGARRAKTIDGFVCYSLDRTPNWFLVGAGEVETRTDRIRLRNVVAEDGRVVLSFHHFPYLVSEGKELRSAPAHLSSVADPLGFIEVLDPPTDFEIHKRSDWR
ncbi:MAG: glycosyltransferase family 2 protein [Deltaproteobacteria bacterium]|nr:glycosyltransferase family 2 protein [Deltaproteobacteria bacterium]